MWIEKTWQKHTNSSYISAGWYLQGEAEKLPLSDSDFPPLRYCRYAISSILKMR